MAKEKPDFEDRFPPMGSPVTAAAMLLGIYIAMYLAIAGLVRLASPADAHAPVPAQTRIEVTTAGATATTDATPGERHADAHSD